MGNKPIRRGFSQAFIGEVRRAMRYDADYLLMSP
jgi:hypothetical protein